MARLDELANRLGFQIRICQESNCSDKEDPRSLFQKEYGKVVFSDYFRAMANKTQVVPIPDNDYTHTRLTHSLEVACLGYGFGERLIKHSYFQPIDESLKQYLIELPVIIATACLLHDIGNPPFGHTGEEAIQEFFRENFKEPTRTFKNFTLSSVELKDFLTFDGNANGFRIVTRLAGKYPDRGENKTGFGLSAITLASLLKYPFPAGKHPKNKAKFGYFQAEEDLFKNQILRVLQDESLEFEKRHPLVYLVEAADDICYTVMDFEDAIKSGNCQIEELWLKFGIDSIMDNSKNIDDKKKREFEKAKDEIQKYDSNKPIARSELKALEILRSGIIGLLVDNCFKNYIDSGIDQISDGNVSYSLLEETIKFSDPSVFENFGDAKKQYLDNSLYCHDRKMKLEVSGYQVIQQMMGLFLTALSEYKSKNFVFDGLSGCSTFSKYLLRYLGIGPKSPTSQLNDYNLCLLVTDFVSQCSDRYLIRLHKSFTDFDIG